MVGYFLRNASPDAGAPGHRQESSTVRPRGNARSLERSHSDGNSSAASRNRLLELEILAARDIEKALGKLPLFRDTDDLPMALAALAKGWAQTDPQAAARWTAQLENPDDQVSAALGLVPAWAANDPEACLAWAGARPSGNLRELSLVELADTWAASQPALALDRFLSMKPEPGTERGLHAIASQWALDDPDKSISHIAALAPS